MKLLFSKRVSDWVFPVWMAFGAIFGIVSFVSTQIAWWGLLSVSIVGFVYTVVDILYHWCLKMARVRRMRVRKRGF